MRGYSLQERDKGVLKKAEGYTQADDRTLVTMEDVASALYGDDTQYPLERGPGLLPLDISQQLGEILDLAQDIGPWFPAGVLESACLLFSPEARRFARDKLGHSEFEKRYSISVSTYLGEDVLALLLARFESYDKV